MRSHGENTFQHSRRHQSLRVYQDSPLEENAHTFNEAFPLYLQPKVSFVEGARPATLENMESGAVAMESPPNSPRPLRRNSLSVLHERSLQVTPLRMPTNRSGFKTGRKELETQGSEYDNPGSSADKSPLSLIAISDICEGEDIGQTNIESSDQATIQA